MKKIIITDEEIVDMINQRKREIAEEIEQEKLQKSLDNLIKRAKKKGFEIVYRNLWDCQRFTIRKIY